MVIPYVVHHRTLMDNIYCTTTSLNESIKLMSYKLINLIPHLLISLTCVVMVKSVTYSSVYG